MADKREQILVRLLGILKTVDGLAHVARNEQAADDWNFPAALLLDGSEAADDSAFGRGRPTNSPNRVTMTPEVYLILGDVPENVGSELNRYRSRILKAIVTDAELKTLAGTTGSIDYAGAATSLTRGREIIGDIGLDFAITYPLNPAAL